MRTKPSHFLYYGSPSRFRTYNIPVKSRLLYQLSYQRFKTKLYFYKIFCFESYKLKNVQPNQLEHSVRYDLTTPDYKTGIFPTKLRVHNLFRPISDIILDFFQSFLDRLDTGINNFNGNFNWSSDN